MIGIMQGRLSPPEPNHFQAFPKTSWMDEFGKARVAGIQFIEWIFDCYGELANPIIIEKELMALKEISQNTGVLIRSICADYFMEKLLLGVDENELKNRLEILNKLISSSIELGINRIVLPFVDSSKIDYPGDIDELICTLDMALKFAEKKNIEIHLETSLNPKEFSELLRKCQHPLLKVNYDSGNSASLGYDPEEEFNAYGNRIGSIHIKDRTLGGGTVPLGQGNVDFPKFFSCVKNLNYSGEFTLQVSRGQPGDEVNWAKKNKQFVESFL